MNKSGSIFILPAFLLLNLAGITLVFGGLRPSSIAYSIQQQPQISGIVLDASTGLPLAEATIQVKELGIFTKTDQDGKYLLTKLPSGTFTVQAQHLGMLVVEKTIKVLGANERLDFELQPNVISLKDVIVVGQENTRDGATSTQISRAAIEHMQATNLGEVLQLLPGAISENPSFNNVNKTSIRQYSGDNTGSLGTSVLINGAPLSNNANLQAMNTATAGVLSGFSTSSGSGVDMRQISADNIESVEVIRGIPSVEYGDLTAGAVLVTTKAGKEPAQLKARINPKLTQFWLGKGFDLGANKGALFADVDFTKANDEQTSAYNAFERVTGNLQYTNTFGDAYPLYTNSTLSFGMNLDESKTDPDFDIDQIVRRAQDYSYRFSTSGKWTLNKKLARSINYNVSSSFSHQKGFQQQYYTADISPVSSAKTDTTMEVDYLASRYLNQLWIDGKPLNIFAKLTDNFYARTGVFNHNFLIGADWKLDANFGDGKTFDESLPPRSSDNSGFRERAFNDIPALNQLGVYIQDRISARFDDRMLALQVGIRYDNIQPFTGNSKDAFSPRINASFDLFKDLTLRAGYGITAKSPTLLYLYPENAYFDFVSLNHFTDNVNERLALMTTRVFDSRNPNLRITKTRKNEIGLDWNISSSQRLSVTGYYEETKNGYEMTNNLNSIQFTSVPIYDIHSTVPNDKPVLSDDIRDSTWVVDYNSPTNSRHIINKGIEFDLDLGRYDQIRTSFLLNGAYLSSRSTSSDPYILMQRVANKPLSRIGVYDTDRGSQSERFVTTLRAVHNIPELRFIVTLTAQTIWKDKNRYINYNSIPTGYIPVGSSLSTPEIVYFTEEERSLITAEDRDIYLSLNEGYFRTESWKPLWLFNIKLTKEFADQMAFSFFANNVINHRPLEASSRYPTEYSKRNISLFFGTELSLKF